MHTINYAKLDLQPGQRLLDLGCGEGRHAIAALYDTPQIEVFYLDLAHKDVSTAKQKLEDFYQNQSILALAIQGDGLRLPFASSTFDHIVCSEVLEHVPQYLDMLNEISRVLKPNGSLSISVPRYWPEKICWWLSREYHEVEGGHLRIFKARSLKRQVEQFQFRFLNHHYAHALHIPYWWLRCLKWNRGQQNRLSALYHKMLVWDLLQKPKLTRVLDRWLNPIMGKSIVLYFQKGEH